jgi:hypothetical protein
MSLSRLPQFVDQQVSLSDFDKHKKRAVARGFNSFDTVYMQALACKQRQINREKHGFYTGELTRGEKSALAKITETNKVYLGSGFLVSFLQALRASHVLQSTPRNLSG